jgi:hypothetical protein
MDQRDCQPICCHTHGPLYRTCQAHADNPVSLGCLVVCLQHSGYPIMTFMDVVNTTVDLSIKDSRWGHLHELGHNHQRGEWTWDCTGEVSVGGLLCGVCTAMVQPLVYAGCVHVQCNTCVLCVWTATEMPNTCARCLAS